MIRFPEHAIDNHGGVRYVPFIGSNQQVGYACEQDGMPTQYIHFNPSTIEEDGESATVFIYVGPTGDPAHDNPQNFYSVPE